MLDNIPTRAPVFSPIVLKRSRYSYSIANQTAGGIHNDPRLDENWSSIEISQWICRMLWRGEHEYEHRDAEYEYEVSVADVQDSRIFGIDLGSCYFLQCRAAFPGPPLSYSGAAGTRTRSQIKQPA